MSKVFLKLLGTLIFISGCTSLQERAEELLHEGSYAEAMSAFRQALKDNPKNHEAHAGLKKAQRGWISKNLIEVRKLRLANHYAESLERLLKVYQNQEQWKISPTGNIAFTQREESHWARASIIQLVEESLKKGKPLRGQHFLSRYQIFFQTQLSSQNSQQLQSEVRQLAGIQCRNQIRNLKKDQYFYGRFIERFCQHWNLPPPDLSLLQKNFKEETYSRVALAIDESYGFPKTFALDLENRLQSKLKDSPWYDSSSERILKLNFFGQYDYNHETEETILTHSYTESVPYEVSRVERKNNSNDRESGLVTGLKIAGMILAAFAGDFGAERKVDNGDGTVTVYETHYRDETRTANYPATSHLEKFEAKMALQGRINQLPVQVVRNEEGSHNSVSHQNKMSGIGLYPKQAALMGPEDWIQNERQNLSVEFARSLKEKWQDLYCNQKHFNGNSKSQKERAFRCLEISGAAPPVGFRRWFQNEYGLSLKTGMQRLYHAPQNSL